MSPQVHHESAHDILDALIARGFCKGSGSGGEICVMQALNLAERGLSDAKGIKDITDRAECAADAPTRFAIRLNDTSGYYGWYARGWSSPQARAVGLSKLAHALLGSKGIDEAAWAKAVGRRYITDILHGAVRALAQLRRYASHKSALLAAATRCEQEGSREAASAARDAANAARNNPDQIKPAVDAAVAAVDAVAAAAVDAVDAAAVEAAVVVAAAAAVVVAAAAVDAAAAVAVVAAAAAVEAAVDAAAVAAAEVEVAAAASAVVAVYWSAWRKRFDEVIGPKTDEMLTRCADIGAEELEFAKAARDAAVRPEPVQPNV